MALATELLGQTVACPHCARQFVMPGAAPVAVVTSTPRPMAYKRRKSRWPFGCVGTFLLLFFFCGIVPAGIRYAMMTPQEREAERAIREAKRVAGREQRAKDSADRKAKSEAERRERTKNGTESGAHVEAKYQVQRRLLSPDSASFDEIVVRDEGNGQWFVRGKVTSANAFNVKIPRSWALTLQYVPETETYRCEACSLDK